MMMMDFDLVNRPKLGANEFQPQLALGQDCNRFKYILHLALKLYSCRRRGEFSHAPFGEKPFLLGMATLCSVDPLAH